MDGRKQMELFERYILRRVSPGEADVLRAFIRDDPRLQRWMEERIAGADSEIDPRLEAKILGEIRSRAGYRRPVRKAYLRPLRIAAAILLPVALAIGVYVHNLPRELTAAAAKGEKTDVTLPDGTRIVINSASGISYRSDFNKKERAVTLYGEAYFDVPRNAAKPFVVTCGELQVKVLGTGFGITAYDDDRTISVVLDHGEIALAAPGQALIMEPDERATYDKFTKTLRMERVDAKEYTGWMDDRLRFENETFANIVKVISRTHNTEIVFADPVLASQRFTGTINNGTIRTALQAIFLTAPVRYELRDGVLYIARDDEKSRRYQ